MKKLRPFLLTVMITSSCMLLLNPPPVHAEKLNSAIYVARATKDLPKGTILSPENIQSTATLETTQIPPRAIWYTTGEDAYGFALVRAVKKNDPICGDDMYSAEWKNRTPGPNDPLWKKYAKSAIICDQRNDFAKSHVYEDGALAELVKLAASKKRIVNEEDASIISDMLAHNKESIADSKNLQKSLKEDVARLQNDGPVRDIKTLEAEIKQRKMKMAQDAQKDYTHAVRVYSVLSAVLPPTSQEVRYAKSSVQNYKTRVTETRNDLTK